MDPRLALISARRNRQTAEALRQTIVAGSSNAPGSSKDIGIRKFAVDGTTFTPDYHAAYAEEPWIVIHNLPLHISEGDLAVIMSQFGNVLDVRLHRYFPKARKPPPVNDADEQLEKNPASESSMPLRGQSAPFRSGRGFVCFEDPRSAVLALDNMNNVTLQLPERPEKDVTNTTTKPAAVASCVESRPLKLDHATRNRVPQLPSGQETYLQWLIREKQREPEVLRELELAKRSQLRRRATRSS